MKNIEKQEILYKNIDIIHKRLKEAIPDFQAVIEKNSNIYGKYFVEAVFLQSFQSELMRLNEIDINSLSSYQRNVLIKMPDNYPEDIKDYTGNAILACYYVPTERINKNWKITPNIEYKGKSKILPLLDDSYIFKLFNIEDTMKILNNQKELNEQSKSVLESKIKNKNDYYPEM
jgi:hypothetical protein